MDSPQSSKRKKKKKSDKQGDAEESTSRLRSKSKTMMETPCKSPRPGFGMEAKRSPFKEAAASRIQAVYRGHKDRVQYARLRT